MDVLARRMDLNTISFHAHLQRILLIVEPGCRIGHHDKTRSGLEVRTSMR